jgi:hypothetical protein
MIACSIFVGIEERAAQSASSKNQGKKHEERRKNGQNQSRV